MLRRIGCDRSAILPSRSAAVQKQNQVGQLDNTSKGCTSSNNDLDVLFRLCASNFQILFSLHSRLYLSPSVPSLCRCLPPHPCPPTTTTEQKSGRPRFKSALLSLMKFAVSLKCRRTLERWTHGPMLRQYDVHGCVFCGVHNSFDLTTKMCVACMYVARAMCLCMK